MLLSVAAAANAAAFLLPYKEASAMVARDVVVLVTMLVAAVLNTVVVVAGGLRRLRMDRVSLVTSLALGVLTITGNLGTAQAVIRVGAGMTSILQQTQLFFVAAAGYLILRERISIRFVVGACLVLVGLVITRAPSASGGTDLVGIAWGLESAASFALIHVLVRRVIDRIQPVPVNALRLWIAGAVLLALPGNLGVVAGLETRIWLLCALAAFVGPFLSRICLMYAVRHITASHSILITLVTPVFAFALDLLVFGELPSGWQLVGSAVIMFGVSIPVLELVVNPAPPPDPR